jgi:hypothetical protein
LILTKEVAGKQLSLLQKVPLAETPRGASGTGR